MDKNREFINLTNPLMSMGETTIKALHEDCMENGDALLCVRATDTGEGFGLNGMVAGSGSAMMAVLSTTILEVSKRFNTPPKVFLERLVREVVDRSTKASLEKNLGSIFDALSDSLKDASNREEQEQDDSIESLAKKLKGRRDTNGY